VHDAVKLTRALCPSDVDAARKGEHHVTKAIRIEPETAEHDAGGSLLDAELKVARTAGQHHQVAGCDD
jgi:hypothetical protein